MFDLVADIDRYAEFLPWCGAARVTRRTPGDGETEELLADMVISYKAFRGAYTSRVTLDRANLKIEVTHQRGPFKHLRNHWWFIAQPDGSCVVDFFIDFEFDSIIFRKLAGLVFGEAVRRMVRAFEARAFVIYAPVTGKKISAGQYG